MDDYYPEDSDTVPRTDDIRFGSEPMPQYTCTASANLDRAMCAYYESMGVYSLRYYTNGVGKFLAYFISKHYDEDALANELRDDAVFEECGLIGFDTDIPLKQKNLTESEKSKQIFEILQNCYKHGTWFKPCMPSSKKEVRTQLGEILNQYPFRARHTGVNGDVLTIKLELQHFFDKHSSSDDIFSLINERYQYVNAIDHEMVTDGMERVSRPTPLQYFISAMQTTSTKPKHEDIWHCIELLLINGALHPSYCGSNSLQIVHQFRKLLADHITDEDIILNRLQFFITCIERNYKKIAVDVKRYKDQINRSIITYNLRYQKVWIMCDHYGYIAVDEHMPSPKLFEFYLNQQYDILHIFTETCAYYDYKKMTEHRILYKEKKSIVMNMIKAHLKTKRSFVKYLLPFREFNRQFRAKKVKEFGEIWMDIFEKDDVLYDGFGADMMDVLLSFVYADMSYLRFKTWDEDREFVNESLKMYSFLSNKWKTWIFNNYILKIPKEELAKLESFAYLCYL
eukprot:249214_1